jgi:putative pyruvate formate lyase activating enzyme
LAKYLQAKASGRLAEARAAATAILSNCTLCPRYCRVDRLAGERGFCGGGRFAEVAGYGPHYGEESVLVGCYGSGTIFFCGCNLRCVFCQNYAISHCTDEDCRQVEATELATVMLELQRCGCHNINFVTPTHFVPQLLDALDIASDGGLTVPLVYNCGGYESLETLQLLDGIIDVYMPDLKFSHSSTSTAYLQAPDYPQVAQQALREMQRQVGDLQLDEAGLAVQGILVRHLLMPGGIEEAKTILRFLAIDISRDCYVNIMAQYHPCGDAQTIAELNRTIAPEVYDEAIQYARSLGLYRLDEPDIGRLLRRLRHR